jgi:hypothetical protein
MIFYEYGRSDAACVPHLRSFTSVVRGGVIFRKFAALLRPRSFSRAKPISGRLNRSVSSAFTGQEVIDAR